MKIRLILSAAKWCILLLLLFPTGCAHKLSVESLSNEWIARPLADLKQHMQSPDSYAAKTGWQEKTYPLANGYYAYVEPLSPDCSIHWSVNQRDIIVDYRAIGSGCQRAADEASEDNMQKITKPATNW